jgi:L-lactate dehydrogenase complex protein LldE
VKIALFITCLTENFYPRAGVAVVKVLEHLGHEVVFPEGQTCCGQPMFNTGFQEEARALAARMIGVFAPHGTVVTPSGSCAAMVREQFPRLLADDAEMHARAEALAGRTYEFVEFLTKVLRTDLRSMGARWEGRATYHYSCHLRALGMTDEAVRLMSQVQGLETLALEKPDQCCGFGGTFAVNYPRISGEMVREKVECVRRTGAGTLVCNESGCAMNIEGACRRERCDVRVTSLAEIIAEGLGLLEPEGAV